jgi:N6-L-threonylcarbamoyladenine synthase
MIILGIETSCDETALALIEIRGSGTDLECKVIQSLVHSQAELHSAYGGVYPNLAKREHGKNLVPLLKKLFIESGEALQQITNNQDTIAKQFSNGQSIKEYVLSILPDLEHQNPDLVESLSNATFLENIPPIDHIAVTEGPGLEPTLWVGITFARILATLWNVPVIPVNHMEGHIVGSLLQSDTPMGTWQKLKPFNFPALALLVSGGHTELVSVKNIGSYEILGQTKDDAVGEAFDKAARLLGLPYPGGPHISRLAQEARDLEIHSTVPLPRPMIGSNDLNFSFSGLKTAVLYAVRKAEQMDQFDDTFKKGLAREFEQAVTETIISKIHAAITISEFKALIVGGGVSANSYLRIHLEKLATEYAIPLFLPSRHISGDNALMIALVGSFYVHTKTPREIRAHGTKKLA